MAKLLYIESSPRKTFSKSIEVSKVFLEAYQKANPKDKVETIDLWDYDLPRFDEALADAKYTLFDKQELTAQQARDWKQVDRVIEHFMSADKYLFSVPMWVFTVPYVLKHYMDILAQPGSTFTYSRAEGFKGRVVGKPVTVIYARGGVYGKGSEGESDDLQVRSMEAFLRLIGFEQIESIIVEPSLGDLDRVMQTMSAAKEKAEMIAKSF